MTDVVEQQPQTVSIELTIEETNAVLKVLGEMPTNSGAFPLLMKIQGQAQEQLGPPKQ